MHLDFGMHQNEEKYNNGPKRIRTLIVLLFLLILCVSGTFMIVKVLNSPPADFPVASDIVIEPGMTLNDIAYMLEREHVVRSSLFIYFWSQYKYNTEHLKAGTYRFTTPLSTREVTEAVTHSLYLSPIQKVTFPEGFKTPNILSFLPPSYEGSDISNLLPDEGYFFPETYNIPPHATIEEIGDLMKKTFREKVAPYEERIRTSGFSERDIVILASIIEREAKDENSMREVSGILQNRLRIDMPLQVDASLDYLLNKTSAELTHEDLALDSPYNTYLYKGLPPGPIANPGLSAIEAVLESTSSPYLYYLTDDEGNFHYARTYEEHMTNSKLYLDHD